MSMLWQLHSARILTADKIGLVFESDSARRVDWRDAHMSPYIALSPMSSSSAILICDREDLFREALRNFLLAAGYSHVEVIATAREAMARLRRQPYGHIFIGMAQPFSRARRLAAIAQRRQPQAKIFLLINANDLVILPADSSDYIIKEHAFASLLNLLKNP